MYKWNSSIYSAGENYLSWNNMYRAIYVCNYVVEQIDGAISESDDRFTKEHVKAMAKANRAFNYSMLVTDYAPFYNAATADTDKGVPMPIDSDINVKHGKSTVKAVYEQIVADLTDAIPYLNDVAAANHRPSKVTAYGLLARVYMYMKEYDKMIEAVKGALAINDQLIDYNTLIPTGPLDFGLGGWSAIWDWQFDKPSIMWYRQGTSLNFFTMADDLIALFDQAKDLRYRYFTTDFSTNTFMPTGEKRTTYLYDHSQSMSMGEIYVMAAEAYIRANEGKDLTKARHYLNGLRSKRMQVPDEITETNESVLLQKVLDERRLELRGKGLRWFDLKRLGINKTIIHTVGDETFTHNPATDEEYYFPIPSNVLETNPLLK